MMTLKSEFASVAIELNETGNGPRLLVRDVRTGKAIYLDPLELEGIAWADHDDLTPLIEPSVRQRR